MYNSDKNWDLVIDSKKRYFELKLDKVWNYRDLLVLLIRRDVVSFYKQTIFGALWFFIQPIFTTITFTIVFGRLAGISTDGLPPVLFYLVGITCWSYFSETLIKNSTVFRDNAGIFGKVYFPRVIMPLSIVFSSMIKLGVQLFLLIIVLLYYNFTSNFFYPSFFIFLFPVVIIIMAGLSLGVGLLVSAMTTKYRDLAFLFTFIIQLLMYATPVIYPLSSIAEENQWIVLINPMTQVIELARLGLIGKGYFSLLSFGYTIVVTLLIMLLGILIFNKSEKNFVDTI
jgi:lipopolysaccharide transport system permease protein